MQPFKNGLSKPPEDLATPLEDALEMTGWGWYSYAIILVAGLSIFSCEWNMYDMSMILPATDCDLNLTMGEKGFISTMTITGMMSTTLVTGYLADSYGRKLMIVRCNFASSVLSFVGAFSPNFYLLAVVSFFNGAVISGVLAATWVYVGEFTPLKNRPFVIITVGALGNLCKVTLSVLAFVLIPLEFEWDLGYIKFHSWRLLILLSSVHSFLSAFSFVWLPESPKFLLKKGYHDEALKALQVSFSVNKGRMKHEFPAKTVCLDPSDSQGIVGSSKMSLKKAWANTAVLFTKPLLKFTAISIVVVGGVMASGYLVHMWMPQNVATILNYASLNPEYDVTLCEVLHTKAVPPINESISNYLNYKTLDSPCHVTVSSDTYIPSIVVSVLQVVLYLFVGTLVHWFGCKTILVTLLLICSALAISILVVTNMWMTIIFYGGLDLFPSFFLGPTMGIVLEYFPTALRSTATSLCLFVGRIGSSLGIQLIGNLQLNYCQISYLGIAFWTCGVAIVSIFLPGKMKYEEPKQILTAYN